MGVSKLVLLTVIAMAFVVSTRCQDDDLLVDELDSATELEKINDEDHLNKPTIPTPTPDKKGIMARVKERVRKMIEKGKQVIKAAREAISKSYSDFKAKTKEIIGLKESDSITSSSSEPSDSQSYPASVVPSEQYPETSSKSPNGLKNIRSESTREENFDPVLRQKFSS